MTAITGPARRSVGVSALRRRSGGRVHLRKGLSETTYCGALTWTADDTDLDLTTALGAIAPREGHPMTTTPTSRMTDRVPVHFVEVDTDPLGTDTRVVLAIVMRATASGDGEYPDIAGLATIDDDHDTIELVRVDQAWRRNGIGKALIAAAETAAGKTLGPSREFSPNGKRLWRSVGRPVPATTRSCPTREGESWGAMLMAKAWWALGNAELSTLTVLTEPVHDRCGGVTVPNPDTTVETDR